MAIKRLVMTCDHCEHESEDDFLSLGEATEFGWFVVQGPERTLGSNEVVYCSRECLLADL